MRLSWRVTPAGDDLEDEQVLDHSFMLSSNKKDPSAGQPPNFKKAMQLRPEQLRSLHWMLGMERTSAPYIEEEVVDDVLAPLGWRAEAKVEVERTVRGGVLADQVGYGKTAITLGLIDATASQPPHAGDRKSVV